MAPLSSSAPIAVCLAAGISQKPVIQKALSLGYQIIGVDQNPQAAAASLCHHMIPLSTHNGPEVVQALKEYLGEKPLAAVLNRSAGPPVATAAIINEAFGLPGVPVKRAQQCLNKELMRQECRRQGVSVVNYQVADCFPELVLENLTFPCVVKPTLSMVGKSGVMIIQHIQDLANAFTAAQAASVNGKVIVEDYLPGQDVSVIAFVNKGSVEILAVLDEINQQHPDGSVSGQAMAVPSRYADHPQASPIAEMTRQVARIFEIHHCPMLLSFRTPPSGDPVLVEIHLDMGGDLILDILLPEAGDFDALGYMIQGLVTQTPPWSPPAWSPTAVVFGQGDGLISRRPYQIIRAETPLQLQVLLDSEKCL